MGERVKRGTIVILVSVIGVFFSTTKFCFSVFGNIIPYIFKGIFVLFIILGSLTLAIGIVIDDEKIGMKSKKKVKPRKKKKVRKKKKPKKKRKR